MSLNSVSTDTTSEVIKIKIIIVKSYKAHASIGSLHPGRKQKSGTKLGS